MSMLKSPLKSEKLEFSCTGRLARSCHKGAQSCHPTSRKHARTCHRGARSCHLDRWEILIFTHSKTFRPLNDPFSISFSPNSSQTLRPFILTQKDHLYSLKKLFYNLKQLKSTHSKIIYFTKVLKTVFYSKTRFSFHTQNSWFNTEILITLT